MIRPSASNLTGWQRRRVKAKASARFAEQRAALTLRLDGRERGRFFSLLRCKPPPSCSAPAAPGSASAGPATTAARHLVLFSLPEPIACCWDLICPEEAWEQPLRWAV